MPSLKSDTVAKTNSAIFVCIIHYSASPAMTSQNVKLDPPLLCQVDINYPANMAVVYRQVEISVYGK